MPDCTALFLCTGLVPASFDFFSPLPDCPDARQSGILAVWIPVWMPDNPEFWQSGLWRRIIFMWRSEYGLKLSGSGNYLLKGTVSRDFLPLVFFSSNNPI
jgi:hypothetical protein